MFETDPVIVIDVWPTWIKCHLCDKDALFGWGVPITDDGQIIPNWYPGDWGGVPVCEPCFEKHAAWSDRVDLPRFNAPLV